MSKDFTIVIYQELLHELVKAGYSFQTFRDYIQSPLRKTILLRHDIDDRKHNCIEFARIQYEKGIKGSYYFRMVPESFNREIIKKLQSMGHEIGYHYEDMQIANGDPSRAIQSFRTNLEKLRSVAEVKTICMHGSPLSRYDNRDLWKRFDYRDFGIIAEPYFDLDYSSVLYQTDSGRRWDGEKIIIRDLPADESINPHMKNGKHSLSEFYSFRHTQDIIDACKRGELPNKIMFNFHPQRWTNSLVLWTWEFVSQNMKNVVKAGLKKIRE